MKTFTILLSITLAFTTIYSKAIDTNDNTETVKINNFSYKFHCSEEKKDCDGYKNDINYACDTISNTFEIYKPVSFEVFVDDLTSKYELYETLAAVTDVNYVPLKTSNNKSIRPHIFPQALAKQLQINKQPKYKENDFTLLVNNCNSLDCKNNEIRSVMIHEMLHGLGFMSGLKVIKFTDNKEEVERSIINFSENDKYAFITPVITSYNKKLMDITKTKEYEKQLNNSKVTNFLPFTIFDKYLVSLKTGERILKDVLSYFEEANKKCFPKGSLSLTTNDTTNFYYSTCLKNLSSKTQKTVNGIIKDNYFDINTLGIETYDGEKVPLQTIYGRYISSSSISHINSPLHNELFKKIKNHESFDDMIEPNTERFKQDYILKYYDENYILYMSDEDDFTVEQMIDMLPNRKKHPLIGNGIVKIMITMGWTQKGIKRNSRKHYLDETISIPEAQTFKYSHKRKYDLENN